MFRPIPTKPAVAIASVTAWRSAIYRTPSTTDPIESVNYGQVIRILALPSSRSQEWTQAQIVDNKHKTAPGFMQTQDLGDWESNNPDSACSLLLLFQPGETASTRELQSSLSSFSQWLRQNPNNPLSPKAHLASAQLSLLLAKNEAGNAQSQSEYLQLAKAQGTLAAVDESLKVKAGDIAKEVAAIEQSQNAATLPDARSEPREISSQELSSRQREQIASYLQAAHSLYARHRYKEALSYVRDVLQIQPHNSAALSIKRSIDNANNRR